MIMDYRVLLGDKENHKPTAHPAMLLHMFFIASAICHSVDIINAILHSKKSIGQVVRQLLNSIHTITLHSVSVHLIGVISTAIILRYGSKVHPFLLADNRHYTFYLWSRFLRFPNIRYVVRV